MASTRRAASPAATVQVQCWHLEEHAFPVVRVRDTWTWDPDFVAKHAAQANLLAQALTPQRVAPVVRQRQDGTFEWQRSDGRWVQRTRRPDGAWDLDPATERWADPRECMDVCDLLELLRGPGAGVYPERGGYAVLEGANLEAMTRAAIPMGANADHGGAYGFLRAIGYPLAVDLARKAILCGRPEGEPRNVPAAEVAQAFHALPVTRRTVTEGERAAILRFCRTYGFPFVAFEPLTILPRADMLPVVTVADLVEAGAFSYPYLREPLALSVFQARWHDFFGAFRVWQVALGSLRERAARGLLGVADPHDDEKATAETHTLRRLRMAAVRGDVGVRQAQDDTATVAGTEGAREPVAAVLDALLAENEEQVRYRADTLQCNGRMPDGTRCLARVRRSKQVLELAKHLDEPLEPLAFCRIHRADEITATLAMCKQHTDNERARDWLKARRANQRSAQAERRARKAD